MSFRRRKNWAGWISGIGFCLMFSAVAITSAQTSTNSLSSASEISLSGNTLTDSNISQDFSTSSNQPTTPQQQPIASQAVTLPTDTNFPGGVIPDTSSTNSSETKLELATYLINSRQPEKAEQLLIDLLAMPVPESIQKTAMLELGSAVRDENDLPRAQSIYSQYLEHWPGDLKIPEVLLRQGEIFRQMGLNDLALGKFYAVMSAALSLKNNQLTYYQSLVLQSQSQIADTHYLMGQFSDAADFYARLLQNTDPALNRQETQFRLVRSLALIKRNDQAVAQASDFVVRFPDAEQVPEVRYYLAEALKDLGRNTEALQQTLLCLREQKNATQSSSQTWTYWQQRIGNDIANELYHEGDYIKALEVYMNLAQLDPSPSWQIPVQYQMGIVYEKLLQPQKAIEAYNAILTRQNEIGTNAAPALQTVFDMARWRAGFVQWQTNAEAINHTMSEIAPPDMDFTNLQTNAKP